MLGYLNGILLSGLNQKPPFNCEDKMMTEDQIEDYFERIMDVLDRKFTHDMISEHDYNVRVESLKDWATYQLSKLQ
jgi:hypothetical protein